MKAFETPDRRVLVDVLLSILHGAIVLGLIWAMFIATVLVIIDYNPPPDRFTNLDVFKPPKGETHGLSAAHQRIGQPFERH